jgi:hypothetical protein
MGTLLNTPKRSNIHPTIHEVANGHIYAYRQARKHFLIFRGPEKLSPSKSEFFSAITVLSYILGVKR